MTNEKLVAYAIKGINAEIEELEKAVKKGRQYIAAIDNGEEKIKTTKTKFELREIVQEKQNEIEELTKYKAQLLWDSEQ